MRVLAWAGWVVFCLGAVMVLPALGAFVALYAVGRPQEATVAVCAPLLMVVGRVLVGLSGESFDDGPNWRVGPFS